MKPTSTAFANSVNAVCLLIALLMKSASLAALPSIDGIVVDPTAVVYLYIPGDRSTLGVELVAPRDNDALRITYRLFSPDESVVAWKYIEYTNDDFDDLGPRPSSVLMRHAPATAGERILSETIDLREAGVYQIRIAANSQVRLRVKADEATGYGVYAGNGTLHPWNLDREGGFVYVPKNSESLSIRGSGIRLRDAKGKEIVTLRGQEVTLDVNETDVLWSFEVVESGAWQVTTSGFPFIVCSDAEAALKLHASIETLTNGIQVAHTFQARAATQIQEILTDRVGIEAEHETIQRRTSLLFDDPQRGLAMIKGFLGTIEASLQTQNIDPRSIWGGSITGWQEFRFEAGEQRWDGFKELPGLWAGLSSDRDGDAYFLALGATFNHPTNPYYGRNELLHRASAAALRDLMVLEEDETWPGIADGNPYPGYMAFPSGQKTFPVYGAAAQHLPIETRDVWTEGLRHIVDRHIVDNLVSTRNQSAHYLVALEAFANGSGDPTYAYLARRFAQRWVAGMNPTGYHEESSGPDASYIGMTHWFEAVAYRMSGNKDLLRSLLSTYRLFNHTVAPEPDGTLIGGFNFNHRVGAGFNAEQWGGARGILDDVLPELAPWKKGKEKDHLAQRAIEKFISTKSPPPYPMINTPRALWYTEKTLPYTLPALEEAAFVRVFDDQFLAVKRPKYYSYLWIGKPAKDPFYIRNREALRALPNDYGSSAVPVDERKVTPFLGGGLSGLWIPNFGHAVLAANWAPEVHHGLVGHISGGQAVWEDYFSTSSRVDERTSSLTVSGRLEKTPVSYSRTYTFFDDRVDVTLELKADTPIEMEDLVENIPYLAGDKNGTPVVARSVLLSDGRYEVSIGAPLSKSLVGGLSISCDSGFEIVVPKRTFENGDAPPLKIGSVAIRMPNVLARDQIVRLHYVLAPVN